MRIGLVYERKADFPHRNTDPTDIDSRLLSEQEEDELLSGLRDAGHEVVRIRDATDLLDRIDVWRKDCDLVLNRSIGYRGNERSLQAPAILEAARIPYIGSTPYVQELVHNKYHAKLVVAAAGVPTPPAAIVRPRRRPALDHIEFPAIVKLLAEGSSVGVEHGKSVVYSAKAAIDRAEEIMARYEQPAIVETFVQGVELEVPLLIDPTPRPLGAVALTLDGAVVRGNAYFAADTVYSDGYGFTEVPPDIDQRRLLEAAARAVAELGIRDYGRVDFRVSEDGTPWFLEADTLPHIQQHSSFCTLARARGLQYHEMLQELVSIAAIRVGLDTRAVRAS